MVVVWGGLRETFMFEDPSCIFKFRVPSRPDLTKRLIHWLNVKYHQYETGKLTLPLPILKLVCCVILMLSPTTPITGGWRKLDMVVRRTTIPRPKSSLDKIRSFLYEMQVLGNTNNYITFHWRGDSVGMHTSPQPC